MKIFKLGKDTLVLTIITLITVLTWVGFEIWLTATKTTITKVTREQMAPINPQINTQVIELLKNASTLSTEEIDQLMSSPPATASSNEAEEATNGESASEPNQSITESSQISTEGAILE